MANPFRTALVAVVCVVTAGCASTDVNSPSSEVSCKDPLTDIGIKLQPLDSLRDSAGVLRPVPQYLLLADTMNLLADLQTVHYPQNPDFNWEVTTQALALMGSPTVRPWGTVFGAGRSSNVVVRGMVLGSSTVTATCGSRSASAPVEVISPTRLQSLTLARSRDSAKVGDTVMIFPAVTDVDSHRIHATVALTTSDSGIAVPGLVRLKCCSSDTVHAMIALAPGTATISGEVAGLRSSFQLRVTR